MVYEIRWLPTAHKQFLKLDRTAQKRISKKLDSIRENPFSSVARLVGFNAYKLRVGDYRAILAIEKNTLVILILKVGHRHSIYKE